MIQSVLERLERIEKKIDGKLSNRYLDINQVSNMTSLSASTIRRVVRAGELKCSKKLGKLLFKIDWVEKWLGK